MLNDARNKEDPKAGQEVAVLALSLCVLGLVSASAERLHSSAVELEQIKTTARA